MPKLSKEDLDLPGRVEEPIELWNLRGVWVVVAAETGVRWTNQVGGVAMFHPVVEGYIVPIRMHEDEPHVEGRYIHDGLCWARRQEDIDQTTWADLRRYARENNMVINSLVGEVAEAWVPVIWNGKKGWLTWGNCD